MLNVLILEDHPMMAESIKASIKSLAFQTKVYTAHCLRDLHSGARFAEMGEPALVVADLNVPDSAGLATLQHLRARYPSAPILIFSQVDDDYFERKALAHGATAFISKSNAPQIFTKKLQALLSTILLGNPSSKHSDKELASPESERIATLSQQQKKVLAALASGLSAQQIALQLQLADQTVRAYLVEIYQRLGVKSRSQAIIFYLQWASQHDSV
jgi:DNA-binding NarL/FixJ family response regulator